MNGQISFNGAQARALKGVLQDHEDGEDVLITQQGTSLYVAFSLASVTIDAFGEVEEN